MKVHIGEFDAESHWADKGAAKLPNYSHGFSAVLVNTMDELLLGFTEENDILIAKRQFDPDLKKYLESLGIKFISFTESEYKNGMNSLLRCSWELEPYAVTECVLNTYHIYPHIERLPNIEIVEKVNSKRYSTELSNAMRCNPHKAYVVQSIYELERVFSEFSNESIVVKEYYGVSGKGSLILSNTVSKNSILKYLKRQEQMGKNINFVVEQFLDKKIDLSAHIYIDRNGKISFLTERLMVNSSLAYQGSCKMSNALKNELMEKGYFETIAAIGQCMFKEGYWGPVCIDSMILKSDEIVPLVEINARKSMGLLHYSLEKKLQIDESWLTFFDLGTPNFIGIKQIIDILHEQGLLYEKNRVGILPLSGNLLKLNNYQNTGKYQKGRLYFLFIAKEKDRLQMINKFKEILVEQNIVIYK